MQIVLISGHRKNWDAGASTVFLHLEQSLRALGEEVRGYHAEDYARTRLPGGIAKLLTAQLLSNRLYDTARTADVVEVAGNLGWHLFRRLRALPQKDRPLLITRIHGLEFKDEQARIDEEIAGHLQLPWKYRALTRHWLNWQEFETIRLADIVICHSSREVDAIVGAQRKAEEQVRLMPLGVDAEYLTERDYATSGQKLLWWGSWVERKGISTLPRAFQLALRSAPGLTLTLGGTGWKEAELLAQFAPEARERVRVLSYVSRAEHLALIRAHDIFVFPSLSEGFGLALLEAMATGMPAITTFTGMAHDWLEHNRNCLLVPMSGATALAAAIVRLSRDAAARQRIGEEARRTATELTWDRLGRETRETYRSERVSARSANPSS